MFGYIRPLHPELKVKDYELYRAVYCGLCRSMGRATGCLSRATLSYDFVFLALLRAALENSGEEKVFDCSYKRCFVHPLSKRLTAKNNQVLTYCARSSAVLTYRKTKDDVADIRGLSKLLPAMLLPAASYMRSRAKGGEKNNNSPDIAALDSFAAKKLSELSELEKFGCDSPDRTAQVFGELLSEVFACGLDGTNERIARQAGLHVGRWVYLCDAAEDFLDDRKTGAYNPFLNCGMPTREELVTALRMELSGVSAAVELITFRDGSLENLIKNIIYLGMTEPIENRLTPEISSGNGDENETGVHV